MWQQILSNCIVASKLVVFTCFSDRDATDIRDFSNTITEGAEKIQAVPVEPNSSTYVPPDLVWRTYEGCSFSRYILVSTDPATRTRLSVSPETAPTMPLHLP